MPTATITFRECIQDSQDFGSDDEHMVSRVVLDLAAEGRTFPNLTVDVKQTVGSSYESGPLEVSRPRGYDGSLDNEPFRKAVERYYRSQVGSGGSGIRIGPGSANLRMRNNRFISRAEVSFEYTTQSPTW